MIDLAPVLARGGVFAHLVNPAAFSAVDVGPRGRTLVWQDPAGDAIDLCADALWRSLTMARPQPPDATIASLPPATDSRPIASVDLSLQSVAFSCIRCKMNVRCLYIGLLARALVAGCAVPALAPTLLVLPAPVAASAEGIVVRDFGRVSCGYWLEVRVHSERPNDMRFVQAREWISGFITGFNWYMKPADGDVVGSLDREGMYAWLDRYCREHPTVGFVKAVDELIAHLRSR